LASVALMAEMNPYQDLIDPAWVILNYAA
jgi:hypothetical protein